MPGKGQAGVNALGIIKLGQLCPFPLQLLPISSQKVGLVDQLGGLQTAVNLAAAQAELGDKLRALPTLSKKIS